MLPQEHLSEMGFAQAGPDVWLREFKRPANGSCLDVTARLHLDGKLVVLYRRDERLHKKRTYTRSPAVAANAIKMS